MAFHADKPPRWWQGRRGCPLTALLWATAALALVVGLLAGVVIGNHIVAGWDQEQEAER